MNLEVPSPINGILSEINAKDGQVVEVGTVLGSITEGKGEKLEKKISKTEENNESTSEIENVTPETSSEKSTKFFDKNIFELEKKSNIKQNVEKPLILNNELKEEFETDNNQTSEVLSPSVRKIVEEKKIDLKSIKGTGKDGRILKGDLINLMGALPKPSERKIKYGQEERIKMSRLRMTIAKRLKEAQETAAMLTTFNEVNMNSINQIRNDHQSDFQNRYGIKLGFMSFFVKACVVGLKSFPAINAEIDNGDIVYKNYYNISFAVATDKGLVVPVLKNADELSFADIEKNIKNMAEKARSGKLTIEDLQGGTFTISNGGVYGSMLSTPILNAPQSGVLGMHNIIERPISVDGEVKVCPMMYLALSYDHRIIDGKDSVSFLKCIKENLEDPRKLFLDL